MFLFAARLMRVSHEEVRLRLVESVKSFFSSAVPIKEPEGTARLNKLKLLTFLCPNKTNVNKRQIYRFAFQQNVLFLSQHIAA